MVVQSNDFLLLLFVQPQVRKKYQFCRKREDYLRILIITSFCFYTGKPQFAAPPVNRLLGVFESSKRQINTSLVSLDNLWATIVEGGQEYVGCVTEEAGRCNALKNTRYQAAKEGGSHLLCPSEHLTQAKSGDKHLLETAIKGQRSKSN